jgi:two-component system capsular synthesis response regulator RcsB
MSLRIIVADDHPIVRVSVIAEVQKIAGVAVVAQAHSPHELLATLGRTPCDLVITDFSMPGPAGDDGMELLEQIRGRWPDVKVIVLTMLSNAGLLNAIRSKGVVALLSKSDRLDDIASAVRAIKAGETYMSASVVRLLGLAAGSVRQDGLLALTEKEIEVLRLFVSGSTISEIALKRERSVKTISHQKMSAMHKLGIRNDPELYNYAHEHGLG